MSKYSTNEGFEDDKLSMKDIEPVKKYAVRIKNGVKRFKNIGVLQNVNLNIEEGEIYALLGSSGSGKTTLLSCVVGISQLDSGSISVFGYSPGAQECGIPGNRLGYQPQDTSLSEEFSIREALHFFGKIYGMTFEKIKEQIKFYINLLDLPHESNMLIRNLSGGEKRRISFAIALMHDPQLLILDEPTVGCDALLRVKMWNHILEIKKTVIITTHHVDDAYQSSMIGLLRNGRLIVEKSPNQLFSEYDHKPLNDIIIQLCLQDNQNALKDVEVIPNNTEENKNIYNWSPYTESTSTFQERLLALIKRNTLTISRNFLMMLFTFCLPALTVFCVHLAVGEDLKDVRFGYVNKEILHYENCSQLPDFPCRLLGLSCDFIGHLERKDIMLYEFQTESEATNAIKDGKIWGFLTFPEYFSDILVEQYLGPSESESENMTKDGVHIKMDATSAQILLSLKSKIFQSLEDFSKNLTTECLGDGQGKENLFVLEDPVYGPKIPDMSLFSIPPLVLVLMFFVSTSLSGLILILEKKNGFYVRTLIAGATKLELVASHFIIQHVIVFIQTSLLMIILIFVLKFKILGSVFLALIFILSQCTIGLLFGYVLSFLVKDESSMLQITAGIMMPNITLSTFMWPIQAMPVFMRYFAKLLPQTIAAESLRSVTNRGWSISHPTVYNGLIVSTIWMIGLAFILIFLSKKKKNLV